MQNQNLVETKVRNIPQRFDKCLHEQCNQEFAFTMGKHYEEKAHSQGMMYKMS